MMEDLEIMKHFLVIYDSLDKLNKAVKLLLDESIARSEKEGIFKDIEEDMKNNPFWEYMNDKKRS